MKKGINKLNKKIAGIILSGAVLASVGAPYASAASLSVNFKISTNTGFIGVRGDKNTTIEAYVGRKRIGKAELDQYGYGKIDIKPQKQGTKIKLYQLDSNGSKYDSYTTTVVKSSKSKAKQLALKKFSTSEQAAIKLKMKKWADNYAKNKHLAVTDVYFTHGAAGWGDWFADTVDGEMQIQDNNLPGYYGFKMHALGGLVFYKPKDGKYGYSEDAYGQATFMNYKGLGPDSSTAYKWLFGDNGKLYEEKKQLKNLGFYTAMGEYSDKGVRSSYPVYGGKFKVSQDTTAQKKYKAILNQYH